MYSKELLKCPGTYQTFEACALSSPISHFVISTLFFFLFSMPKVFIYVPKSLPYSNSPGFLTDVYIIAARTFVEIH